MEDMLRSLRELNGYRIRARDGVVGSVVDALFSDVEWNIRYLAVDTGTLLPGKKVLLSLEALGTPDWLDRTVDADLTKEQIRQSMTPATDRPVSRQHEGELHAHYSWPIYRDPAETQDRGDPHLRSAREITGYEIAATDGSFGHVEDLVFDAEAWVVRYVVIDTRSWWPAKKVLMASDWIQELHWKEGWVRVPFSRETVKSCPEYDPSQPVNREHEMRLHDYYGRPVYW